MTVLELYCIFKNRKKIIVTQSILACERTKFSGRRCFSPPEKYLKGGCFRMGEATTGNTLVFKVSVNI